MYLTHFSCVHSSRGNVLHFRWWNVHDVRGEKKRNKRPWKKLIQRNEINDHIRNDFWPKRVQQISLLTFTLRVRTRGSFLFEMRNRKGFFSSLLTLVLLFLSEGFLCSFSSSTFSSVLLSIADSAHFQHKQSKRLRRLKSRNKFVPWNTKNKGRWDEAKKKKVRVRRRRNRKWKKNGKNNHLAV